MLVKSPLIKIEKLSVIVNDEFSKAGILLSAYAQSNTHGAKYRPGIRASVKSRKLYGGRNPTNKLYSETGNLLRALQPKAKGNVFEVLGGKQIGILYGIKLDVIPYARIHELGGVAGRGSKMIPRPYVVPAIKEFFKNDLSDIIQNIFRRLSE